MSTVAVTKFFDLIVLLSCNNQTVMALPIDSNRTAVSVGRVPRSKATCLAKQKPVAVLDFLATPHQSFDLAYLRLPQPTKKFFKLSKSTIEAGTKVFSLKASSENRSFPVSSSGLIDSCEHAQRGLTQLQALPAEERATHPDQDYGLRLWLRYCELKAKPQRFSSNGTWQNYEIVSGTVLWADEINLLTSLPPGEVGSPIINEKGELVGLHTGLTPFKQPEPAKQALSVSKAVSTKSKKILVDAKKNGLWDY